MGQQNFKLEASNAKDANELLRDLANNLIIGVYIVQDGKFLFTNSVFQKLVSYSEKELLGMDSLSLVYPEDRDRARENAVKMLKGESSSPYELRYVNKSGESSWVIETVVSISYQGRRATMGNFMNITDRKQTETKYRQLLEDMSDGYAVIQEGKYVFANRRFGEIFKYEPEQILGKSLAEFMMPEDRQAAMETYERVMSGEEAPATQYEGKTIIGDGTIITIEASSKPIQYEGKPAIGIIIRDITERKKAEQAIVQSERSYKELAEGISDIFVAMDEELRYTYWNKAAEEIIGISAKDALGKYDYDLFRDNKGARRAKEIYQEVIKTKQLHRFVNEYQFGSKDFIFEITTYPSGDGISVFARNITKQKMLEKKLLQATEEWRITFDSISDLVSIHDKDFNIVKVNKAAVSALHIKPEELIGKKCYEVFHRTTAPVPSCPHGKTLNTKKPASSEFFEPHLGIHLEVATSPILSNEGNVVGSVHIARNVTERKMMEENLKELYEQEIELREGLEAERRKRIEFTRVLVHELKTPLTPMLASSQLLLEELHGEETLLRLAKNISQGTLNLSNRVDELHDLIRGETGILRLEIASVDPLPLLQRAADAIAPMASSNGHSLILDLPLFLPSVRADQGRLQQIILNLLNNASKFTPKGGKIILRARKYDDALVVEVQDTGHGITKEEHERIFDPYYRVENDRQRFSGMGLGLALCKKLVELHGGQIWVKSRPNEGSTFGFSLPLEDH